MCSEREPQSPGVEPKRPKAAFTSPHSLSTERRAESTGKQPEHSASERRKRKARLSPAAGNRRCRRFAFVVFGINYDVTLRGFAATFGAKVFEVAQGEVKNAPFAG